MRNNQILNMWQCIHFLVYRLCFLSDWVDLCLSEDNSCADTMMTSSNGNIFALLALCEGNPPLTGGFPHKGQWRRDWSAPEQLVEETIETPVIWDAIMSSMTLL